MEHSRIQIPPPAAFAAVPGAVLAVLVDHLIEALDRQDGDLDLEVNGLEDDFMDHGDHDGPGCPVADGGEYAWPEWLTRGRHKEPMSLSAPESWGYHEDDEDNDPKEDDTQDRCAAGDDDLSDWGPFAFLRQYGCGGIDEKPGDPEDAEYTRVEAVNQDKGQPRLLSGCHYADDDAEHDDPVEANGDELDVSYRNDTRGNLDPCGPEDDEWGAVDAPVIVSRGDLI